MPGTFGSQTIDQVGRGVEVIAIPHTKRAKPGGVTIDWSTVPNIGRNESVTFVITGTPTGGTYKLSYGGQETASLAYNADAPAIEAALELLSTIGNGNIQVSGTWPSFTLEGVEDLREADLSAVTLSTNAFTGGSSPSATITEAVKGVSGAGATLSDGTVVKQGDKYLEFGTVLVKITASGKFGPADTAAADGRQTVDSTRRGDIFVLNHTVLYSEVGSEIVGDVFDAGICFKTRIKCGGTGQPTYANLEAACPGISYANN